MILLMLACTNECETADALATCLQPTMQADYYVEQSSAYFDTMDYSTDVPAPPYSEQAARWEWPPWLKLTAYANIEEIDAGLVLLPSVVPERDCRFFDTQPFGRCKVVFYYDDHDGKGCPIYEEFIFNDAGEITWIEAWSDLEGYRPTTDADPWAARFSFGWRLAEGLPDYLWACPHCHALRGLQVAEDRDRVECTECGSTWRVDIACKLHGTTNTTVARAHDVISQHRAALPLELESNDDGVISLIPRGADSEPEVVARGRLRLDPDALHVGEWSLPLAEIRAISVEIRNELWLYQGDKRLRLEPGSDSTLMWAWFLQHGKAAIDA